LIYNSTMECRRGDQDLQHLKVNDVILSLSILSCQQVCGMVAMFAEILDSPKTTKVRTRADRSARMN